MNNDLISRSALIGAFPVVTKDDKVSLIGALFGFVDIICNAPAVDAVEAVRCEDCKHGRPINKQKSQERYYRDDCVVCECENVVGNKLMVYKRMHFCSYGERRHSDD